MSKMNNSDQDRWIEMCRRLGPQEARYHLAKMLRFAADKVEAGDYPDVYGCDVPDEPFKDGRFTERFSVVLSYPWPG